MRMMHKKMKDHQMINQMLTILALLTTNMIFAYWPLLQFLLSRNANLKGGVCKFVVSFALDPVLAIAIEILRFCTKISTKDAKHKKLLNLLCIVYMKQNFYTTNINSRYCIAQANSKILYEA